MLKKLAFAIPLLLGTPVLFATSASSTPPTGVTLMQRACAMECATASTHRVHNATCTACVCAERSVRSHHDASDCSKCATNYFGPNCDATCSTSATRDQRTKFCQSLGDPTAFSESSGTGCKCHCSAGYATSEPWSACVKECAATDVACQRDNTPSTCTGPARDNRTAYCHSQGDPYAFANSDCSCKCSSGYAAPGPDAPCLKECDLKDAACHLRNKPSSCTGAGRDLRTMYCQSEGDPNAFANSDCSCHCSSGHTTLDNYSACVDESMTQITLNLLQYNVQLYPGWPAPYNSPEQKAELMAKALPKVNDGKVDVFTFSEGFSADAKAILVRELKKAGWKYHTSNTDTTGCRGAGACHSADCYLSDGGSFIVSKYEILATDQIIYHCCNGSSCKAAKGVKYAKIRKAAKNGAKTFHLFATHLQSDQTSDDAAARKKQFEQFRDFISSKHLPAGEPVLMAGDFNIDSGSTFHPHPLELGQTLATLNAAEPERIGTQRFTSDPTSNTWVGFDGDAKAFGSFDQYYCAICNGSPRNASEGVNCVNQCKGSAQFGVSCHNCPRQYLDYVLTSKAHQAPELATTKVIVLKAGTPFDIEVSGVDFGYNYPYMRTSDFSDHYPLLGSFVFKL